MLFFLCYHHDILYGFLFLIWFDFVLLTYTFTSYLRRWNGCRLVNVLLKNILRAITEFVPTPQKEKKGEEKQTQPTRFSSAYDPWGPAILAVRRRSIRSKNERERKKERKKKEKRTNETHSSDFGSFDYMYLQFRRQPCVCVPWGEGIY